MILPLFSSLLLAASAPAASALSVETCQLGQVSPFAEARCTVVVSNASDHAVTLTGVKSLSDGVLSIHAPPSKVPAHGRSVLEVRLNVGNAIGGFSYLLAASTDDPDHPQLNVPAHGFALSPIDQRRPKVDLGVVRKGGKPVRREYHFSSETDPDFRIGKVLEAPAWLQVKPLDGKQALEFSIRPDAPLGLVNGYAKFALDTPTQTQLWVWVDADVQGDVVPDTNPFNMGLMRRGNDNEFLIRLTSRSGKPFSIGKLSLSDVQGKLGQEACTPASPDCRLIHLKLSDKQPLGTVKGRLWVELTDSHQRLPINLWGMFLDKDTRIGEIGGKPEGAGKSSAVPESVAPVDLSKALAGISQPRTKIDDTPPPGKGPLLRWSVENEKSVYGFQVFRADSADGRFRLLTAQPIPTLQETNELVSYQWRDTSAQSGKTYWYYIRAVNMDGSKTRLVSPQKVVAK